MQKTKFSICIKAPAEKVWEILWNDTTYRKWTSVFHGGSYAVSDWKEGSDIHFLTPEGSGMFSKIEKMIPNKFMSFKHLGNIKNFVPQPNDIETEKWMGAHENYTIEKRDNETELIVELDIVDEHLSFFLDVFPKALDLIKEIAEEKPWITIKAKVQAPPSMVWTKWTDPKDIVNWNTASPDWHTTKAINELRVGGKFVYRMEAKDGSMGFDFSGSYVEVKENELLSIVLDDNRKMRVEFKANGSETEIIESFQAESENSLELQESGWQAILNNFKSYVEKG